MVFDDGLITVVECLPSTQKGDRFKEEEAELLTSFFCYETVGVNRYYAAMSHGIQIDAVVALPFDERIKAGMKARIDQSIFRIVQAQQTRDNLGLKITKLSLEENL